MNAYLHPHVLTVQEMVAQPVRQREKLTPLACAAIAGVVRNAQSGNLPLFTSTLGLGSFEFRNMVDECLTGADADALRQIPAFFHVINAANVPRHFAALVRLFMEHRSAAHAERPVRWLTHAMVAAAFGYQPMWKDMDLDSAADTSQLMDDYFPSLAKGNHNAEGWKRHLFLTLGNSVGITDMEIPGCQDCENYHRCFAITQM